MSDFLARPWLLLAAPLIYWVLNETLRSVGSTSWADILPAELAKRLLTQGTESSPPLIKLGWLLAGLTFLFTLALAGVGYVLKAEELPNEQHELVILQQLSPAITGSTAPQQQLETSQRVLMPLLNARKLGKTALVYYAGSAHLVSPMTDDTATLRQLLSLTHPSVMPLGGNNPEAAFKLAASLGKFAQGKQAGRLDWLVLTANLPGPADLQRLLNLKPATAKVYLVWLTTSLKAVSQQQKSFSDLGIHLLHPDDLPNYTAQLNRSAGSLAEENLQALRFFQELSHWPLLLGMLLLLWQYFEQPRFKLPFKLGFWLFLLVVGASSQQPLQAAAWQNLDYQAWLALKAGEAEQAQKLAKRTDLKAHAEFLLGNYAKAAELFTLWQAENPTQDKKLQAEGLYNRGTAWLMAGLPKLALDDFKQAEALYPDWPESCFNRELAKTLLAKQPTPTEESLVEECASVSSEPVASQPEEPKDNNQEAEQDWQPQENPSCTDCIELNATQEKQLQQLQEDPWRLLKYRFKSELKEQRP
ncbi:VWA domain-containing protein [Marinospirillum insulare]|uniref:Ca-activated chloride channel family protein n=1 Tax=Marinospirillum insulare TaxID=217169 RepID=A0ABQ5ZY39_9GAMM|nr:VWA domain-containing protein [Marinospirillum insulare]GLR64208.1 hypothetical protein GCM10007878_16460 [Marinospirillum insulare]